MRCRGCGYALWGIVARLCPECGQPFKVSERVFVPKMVVFSCPGCATRYVGTSEDGLPEPSAFACAGCSAALTVDDLVLRPADGVRGRVEIDPTPWCERKRLGHWRAWFRTVLGVWARPGTAVLGTPRDGPMFEALWFGAWTWVVASLVGIWGISALIIAGIFAGAVAASAVGSDWGLILGIVTSIGGVLVMALPFWVVLFFAGCIAHGLLRVTGDTRHGLKGTMDATGYSSAIALLSAIPCLGIYFVPVAVVVQCVFGAIMLSSRQRVAWWRSSLAVAPVVALTMLIVMAPAMLAPFASRFAPRFVPNMTAQTPALRLVGVSILWSELVRQRISGGPEVAHGVELIGTGPITAEMFVEEQLQHSGSGAGVLLPVIERELRTRWEAQRLAMPADVIAHRVGQYVFTHHGIDPNSTENDLWVVVSAPVPVSTDLLGGPNYAVPGVFDGSMIAMTRAGSPVFVDPTSAAAQLQFQNALRVKEGLPPLPDPFTILEGKPAVAGSGP